MLIFSSTRQLISFSLSFKFCSSVKSSSTSLYNCSSFLSSASISLPSRIIGTSLLFPSLLSLSTNESFLSPSSCKHSINFSSFFPINFCSFCISRSCSKFPLQTSRSSSTPLSSVSILSCSETVFTTGVSLSVISCLNFESCDKISSRSFSNVVSSFQTSGIISTNCPPTFILKALYFSCQ